MPAPKSGAASWSLFLDAAGIAASLACLVHCAALPLLVLWLPLLSASFVGQDSDFLRVLTFFLLVLAPALAWASWRRHAAAAAPLLMVLGVLLILVFELWEGLVVDQALRAAGTALGGVLLIAGHLRNIASRKRAGTC